MNDKKKKEEIIAVPLEFSFPSDLKTEYATNMVIQHGQHEFFIYFFEAQPPIFLGSPKNVKQQSEELKSISAKCVSKIVVSADRMQDFVEAFNSSFEKYKRDFKKNVERKSKG